MSEHVSVAELDAAADVVRYVRDGTDSLGWAEVVEVRAAADRLKSAVNELIALLDTQATQVADGQPEIVRDGVVYGVRGTGRWRYFHEAIGDAIVAIATLPNPETGEIPTPIAAARAAVDAMRGAYVPESAEPSQRGLVAAGVPVDGVRDWHDSGVKRITVTPVSKLSLKRKRALGLIVDEPPLEVPADDD